ncbi:MAG: D-xylose transport system substrate-binding protein [Petroclostridium sp.]|jgi:D-xylose transport system substrate-binding protein|uniref:sugar ABC transporter substrate-binding protein n=1 Tax=Petroclostridium xylanilyticum TaxID=1792311 RepID=UPI000B99B525|nr:substrate-binding domain-containing protein [Petroclostridium xylanilyticum]MDK2811107.1 D-xylose transport system substrate-binding protein [Petroclostridium sp.]
MRKTVKIIALILALMMAVSVFAGCNSAKKQEAAPAPAPAPEKKEEAKQPEAKTDQKIVVGLSLPTQREERWVRDKETMEAEAKKLGIDLKVQISDNDAGKQMAQAENLLAQGINVLILAPHDATGAAPIVDMAHKAGVKVISYDRLVMNSDVDLYISFDNVKVGEIQGKYITEKVPKGNYLVLAGSPTDNNAKLFREGAMKYIQPLVDKGDIKVVHDEWVKDWQPSEAMKIAENALTANKNDIQAVLAPNDGTAGGVIQALAAQGLAGKVPVTGQDAELAAAKRIVEGIQSMTVFKDTRELGKAAIAAAIKMAKGESIESNGKVNNNKIDVPSLLLTPIAVDKDNLDKVLIDSGYLKKEDVYKK